MNLSLWRVKHANKCSPAFECLSLRQLELCTLYFTPSPLSLPTVYVCVAIINNQKWHKVCGISDAFAPCLVCLKVLVALLGAATGAEVEVETEAGAEREGYWQCKVPLVAA